MTLDNFVFNKEIIIDDSGWGDLVLGVIIGALELPNRKYLTRRIPVAYFQSPLFENKKYLEYSVKIAKEIIDVMKPNKNTIFKVCSGYVLSSIRDYLQNQGFTVKKVEVTGDLQNFVERSFARWCKEEGVIVDLRSGSQRFWALLDWVSKKPELRELIVKTGWKSWKQKWRKKVFQTDN